MEDAQTIGEIIMSGRAFAKCDNCQLRPAMWDRKWCRPCALQWQRKQVGYRNKNRVVDYSPVWESEIPERYQGAELEHLPDALVEQFRGLPDDMGLFLWGPPGRGKTYSSAAFAKSLWTDGWDIRRIAYDWLMLEIRDTYKASAEQTEKMVIQPLIQVGKLFIEDVGVTVKGGHEESDFSLRTFVLLLDKRLESCRGTFITSNKSIEELAKSFDGRVASRLQQGCQVVKLDGKDRRIQKQ
jgi:DNA replication protein DnaC